jgi:type I restriction enzyme S subunit
MDKKKRDDMITEIQVVDVPFHWVNDGEKRLDASFYTQDVIAARIILGKIAAKVRIDNLKDIVNDIFMPALKTTIPFYDNGKEYLTQSEVEFFLPQARKRVNISKIDNPEQWKVKSGFLLVSQSGTTGRVTMATKYLEKFIISPNPIRIVVKEDLRGYVYAYLSSWIGQALIKSPQYGITVKHILPHHLYNIPIPRIQDEEEIHQKILEAHKLREEAQELLLKAEEMIYSELGLPRIDVDDIEYFSGEIGRVVKAFEIKASELDYRLDASHHLPLAHLAISTLERTKVGNTKKLKDIANSFVPPRFKRPYVKNPDDGVPLLQGAHIPKIKPFDIKFIWKKMINLAAYIVKRNWILVTCSGTIGRLALVSNYWDGWAATNHLLRIIPREDEINPGYLTAFLLSIYGQAQFQRLIYGGVVDEIGEAGGLFNDILILKPKDKTVEDKIGSLVIEAYNKKDKANQIEEETIKKLERALISLAFASSKT